MSLKIEIYLYHLFCYKIMPDYFVCLENRIGEAHWTRFDSKDTFEERYGGVMEDGTLFSVEYPRIPYQGTDEKVCSETAVARNQRLLKKPDAYALMRISAEMENWNTAKRIYLHFFSD